MEAFKFHRRSGSMFDERASERSTSRRQFLRHAGIAAGLIPLARPALAQAKLRDVTLRLDWLFQGPNGGFMVAQDKGFYRDVGLNADIGPGKGSGSTAQLVASKATQFGFSDGFVVGLSGSRGMSIRTVGAIYRRNPTAVIVLAESDIKTPKDLEGKTVGIPTGGTQFSNGPPSSRAAGSTAARSAWRTWIPQARRPRWRPASFRPSPATPRARCRVWRSAATRRPASSGMPTAA